MNFKCDFQKTKEGCDERSDLLESSFCFLNPFSILLSHSKMKEISSRFKWKYERGSMKEKKYNLFLNPSDDSLIRSSFARHLPQSFLNPLMNIIKVNRKKGNFSI